MGTINFTQSLHDSHTVSEALEQYERLTGKEATEVFVDRGYKGVKVYKASKIYTPVTDKISRKKEGKSIVAGQQLNL